MPPLQVRHELRRLVRETLAFVGRALLHFVEELNALVDGEFKDGGK